MKKHTIVFLASSASLYGAERALLETIRNLGQGFDPIVLIPESGDLEDAVRRTGASVHLLRYPILERKYFHPLRIFFYKAFAVYSIVRLFFLFRRLKPAVVHTNNVLILPGALASCILRIPHVWHVREIIRGHHIHPSLWKIWRWLILTFSDRVICISNAVSEQFGGSEKVVIVHDGVDTDTFRPMTNRTSSAGKPEPIRFGIVGRLEHRRKGQDLFIEAADIALKQRSDLEFVIAGHERAGMEQEEQKLHDMVAAFGHEKKIQFRGFVQPDHMPSLMNELDVLVLCSKQPEGLAIVLLESMACGKPVISFAEGGPLDVVQDDLNGLLVPPRDVEKLADAMLRLASDEKLRRRLGEAGRKMVGERFRSDSTARKIESVYRTILKERSLQEWRKLRKSETR